MKIGDKEKAGDFRPAYRVTDRMDWDGYEFTPAMISAAQANAGNKDTLWTALRESGYLDAAIATGGGVIL